ncbi:epidermal retinol dehydrogenase 2-like [Mya arenaria]|uniref:epidermal retinol dehydrogenase 2-like n=1 Tax=Mya arenaria TaxID=6604 RepID=UPI0022E10A97|nr:epidermal retinol dehydrogenase 2-like [Mya arenaria]
MENKDDSPFSIFIEAVVLVYTVLKELTVSIYRFFISPPRKSVRNNIVLITGSGGTIGRELCVRFSKLGATLVLWDINLQKNEETATLIKESGGVCYTYTVDVGKHEDVSKVGQLVLEEVGVVDILVNNAAVVSGRSLLECPDEMIERTFDVNLLAQFWTAKFFLPYMIKRNHGHVVNIASSTGLLGLRNLTDYSASKFGVVGFSEVLNLELVFSEADGVHTTLVCPSFVKTSLFQGCDMRFPAVLPPLEVSYCADKIVHAVLTNQVVLYVPRIVYFFTICKTILPVGAMNAISNFFGAVRFMDNFVHVDNGNDQAVPNRSMTSLPNDTKKDV